MTILYTQYCVYTGVSSALHCVFITNTPTTKEPKDTMNCTHYVKQQELVSGSEASILPLSLQRASLHQFVARRTVCNMNFPIHTTLLHNRHAPHPSLLAHQPCKVDQCDSRRTRWRRHLLGKEGSVASNHRIRSNRSLHYRNHARIVH